jgi:hypothetical protein
MRSPDADVTLASAAPICTRRPAATSCRANCSCARCATRRALPGFQFGDIAEENLSRSLDEVQTTLDEKGHGEVTTSQWQDSHSPLQVVLQASLLESGGDR